MKNTLNVIFVAFAIWSIIEIMILSIFIFIAIRKGLLLSILEKNGTYKKKLNAKGKITGTLLMIGFSLFPISFDIFVLKFQGMNIPFYFLFLINILLLMIVFLWDTLIIDLLILPVWRPKFLKIPDELTSATMKKHVISSITIQLIPLIIIGFLISIIFYFI